VEGGGGGLTVSGVSRNRGGFVKCVAIQKRLGIPDISYPTAMLFFTLLCAFRLCNFVLRLRTEEYAMCLTATF
jgi:hypothetical protein